MLMAAKLQGSRPKAANSLVNKAETNHEQLHELSDRDHTLGRRKLAERNVQIGRDADETVLVDLSTTEGVDAERRSA